MPHEIRLPAEVTEGEVRVRWEDAGGGGRLTAVGPDGLGGRILAMLSDPRFEVRQDVGLPERMRLLETSLARVPSMVEVLEAGGFDPRSLVVSIRRTGTAAAPAALPDGVRDRLEQAQASLAAIGEAMDAGVGTKGVHVLAAEDKARMDEALAGAVTAVSEALGLASGHVAGKVDAPKVSERA